MRCINIRFVARVLSVMALAELVFMLFALGVALYYKETTLWIWIKTILITLLTSFALYSLSILSSQNKKGSFFSFKEGIGKISSREGVLTVTLTWLIITFVSLFPFILGNYCSLVDAIFETISGFTTTGATIFKKVSILPKSILFWRALLQWQGGIGIIVFTVALIPIFRGRANQLYNAETTGIVHDKFLPHIRQVAARLWFLYLLETIICTIFLCFSQMSVFDAICHSLSCLSTGGFSTQDAGILAYQSPYIEYVLSFFMFIGGMNLTLIYFLFIGKGSKIRKDEELRGYIFLLSFFSLLMTVFLFLHHQYPSLEESFRRALFQIISISTTTGFLTADYNQWGYFFIGILLIIMPIGGCTGSTSGGLKVARILVLHKNLQNEFKKRCHPNMIVPVRMNGQIYSAAIVSQILAFVFLYVGLALVGSIAMSMIGIPYDSSLILSISSLSGVGPGTGKYISDCQTLIDGAKLIMSFLMLVGRLEIFTVLLIFHPSFWRI